MRTLAVLLRRLVPVGFVLAGSLLAASRAAADGDDRAHLAAERRALTERFAAEERACRDRFAVTACVDDVRVRRRKALQPLRERELQIDDVERRQRAAQRQAEVEARRAAAAQRPPEPPMPPPEVRLRAAPSASAAAVRAWRTPASAAPPHAARPPDDSASRAAQAAERVRDAAQRASDAEATRATIARRLAERERSGKKSDPLPVPAAANAASR